MRCITFIALYAKQDFTGLLLHGQRFYLDLSSLTGSHTLSVRLNNRLTAEMTASAQSYVWYRVTGYTHFYSCLDTSDFVNANTAVFRVRMLLGMTLCGTDRQTDGH